jgi:hypothetical protein
MSPVAVRSPVPEGCEWSASRACCLVAKRAGLLASVGVALAELSRHQYRLSDALVQEVLRLAGELD